MAARLSGNMGSIDREFVRKTGLVGVAFGRTQVGEIPEPGKATGIGYFPSEAPRPSAPGRGGRRSSDRRRC